LLAYYVVVADVQHHAAALCLDRLGALDKHANSHRREKLDRRKRHDHAAFRRFRKFGKLRGDLLAPGGIEASGQDDAAQALIHVFKSDGHGVLAAAKKEKDRTALLLLQKATAEAN
jgi:hypothetical protein